LIENSMNHPAERFWISDSPKSHLSSSPIPKGRMNV
jgi:hypothetical protein